jgi:hypothetical protein
MATNKTKKTIRTVAKKTAGQSKKTLGALPTRATAKTANGFAQYALPGAAVLGSGLLATAGILLRDQLGRIMVSAARNVASGAVTAGHAGSKELEFERLLSHVGLQRRGMPVLGASLGVLAGVVAGSALAMWLGPMVRAAFRETKPSVERKAPLAPPQEQATARRVPFDGAGAVYSGGQ